MYVDLLKFVMPLSVTLVVTDACQLAVNAAISRFSKSDGETMGVFTAVFFFALLLTSFTKSFKPVVLSLPETRQDFLWIMRGFIAVCITLFLLSILIGNTPLAYLLTGMESAQADSLRTAFVSFSVLPTLRGCRYVLEGVLSRKRIAMPQAAAVRWRCSVFASVPFA